MSVDKVNLKALAEAATGGPWVAAGPSFGSDSPQYCEEVLVDREGDEDDTYTVCEAPAGLRSESTADMEFIAAANPAAVLALLAEIDRLAADEQEATELCDHLSVLLGGVAVAVRGPEEPKSRHGFHDLPSRVKTVVGERDQLKAENEQLRKDAERFRHLMFNHVDWARNGKDDDAVMLEFGPYPSHKLRETLDADMAKKIGDSQETISHA